MGICDNHLGKNKIHQNAVQYINLVRKTMIDLFERYPDNVDLVTTWLVYEVAKCAGCVVSPQRRGLCWGYHQDNKGHSHVVGNVSDYYGAFRKPYFE